MYKIMEQGRSMIEMLGVLAIIGVLSIGGLQVVNHMQASVKSNKMATDLMEYAANAKKLACEFERDDGYNGNFAMFVYKNNANPVNWQIQQDGESFKGVLSTVYQPFHVNFQNVEEKIKRNVVGVLVSNLDEGACMNLATMNIGSNLLESVRVNGTKIKTNELDKITNACNKKTGNYVCFRFKGCM